MYTTSHTHISYEQDTIKATNVQNMYKKPKTHVYHIQEKPQTLNKFALAWAQNNNAFLQLSTTFVQY